MQMMRIFFQIYFIIGYITFVNKFSHTGMSSICPDFALFGKILIVAELQGIRPVTD